MGAQTNNPDRGSIQLPLTSERAGVLLAIAALGAFGQIAQALLAREALIVFHGNELTLGALYGGLLFWIAVGSIAALRLRRDATAVVPVLLLVMTPLLALQLSVMVGARLLLDVPASQLIPLGELFTLLFAVTLPLGLLLGLAFPLACRLPLAGAGERRVASLYAADAMGALLGGAGLTWLLMLGIGLVQTLGLSMLLLALAALVAGAGGMRLRIAAIALAAGGCALVLPGVSGPLQRQLEQGRFAVLQPGLELVDALTTRHGHLAVGRRGEQISLVADGKVSESFPLPLEVRADAALLMSQANSEAPEAGAPRRVLSIGGFFSGLSAELLRYDIEALVQTTPDRRAFERVRPLLSETHERALADPRFSLVYGDARQLLSRMPGSERFDLVTLLFEEPGNAAGNRFFTQDFYRIVAEHLRPRGVFCARVAGASNYVGSTVGGYAGSVLHTLESQFREVALIPGDQLTLCAAKTIGQVSDDSQRLARRYQGIQPQEPRFPASGFASLVQADEVAYLRQRLDAASAQINTDARPITYLLNLLLWAEFSASGLVATLGKLRDLGHWPYLIPAGVFLGLWLLRALLVRTPAGRSRREAGTVALFVLGLLAMALQLTLLLAYQAKVGLLFERLALLNGLFMFGLALGALCGRRLRAAVPAMVALALILALVGGGALLLPWLLAGLDGMSAAGREIGFLLLCLGAGLLAGAGFPIGAELASGQLRERADDGAIARGGGIAQAADNLGGALGALVTATALIPILGIAQTGQVLAALTGMALVVLAMVGLRAKRADQSTSTESGSRHLAGWVLAFVVLCVYGWTQLAAHSAPAPRIHFDPDRIAALGDAQQVQEHERPFVHYSATGSDGVAVAAVSTLAVAPEIKGYAGPINLLLVIDEQARLRGLDYVGSNETPSYIDGIQGWLDSLVGRSLREESLELGELDGLSGATVTSRAALASINAASRGLSQARFARSFPPGVDAQGAALGAGLWASLLLLVGFVPVYLSRRDSLRVPFLVATAGVLGLWLNAPITEIDLINLSLGHVASPLENPQRWLLIGTILLGGLLLGQVWCGWLCPFGAVQELISRLGRVLGLRRYPDRRVDRWLRRLKFGLLAAMLVLVWASGEVRWASFDPMQWLFGGAWDRWMWALSALVLLACLFYVRFWCRYLCPLGAALALTNGLALLERLAPRLLPKRRFEHCDLGVRSAAELDCIRCSRCVCGVDTRLKRRSRGSGLGGGESSGPTTPDADQQAGEHA